MQLTGKQKQALEKALCDAFTDKPQFTRLVDYEFNENLENIIIGNNKTDIAIKLINKADSEGWVDKLMKGALNQNSGNPKLKFAVAAIVLYQKFLLLNKDYNKQIEDSYLAWCDFNQSEFDSNEYQKNKIIESVFNFEFFIEVITKEKSNCDYELNKLINFVAIFLINSKSLEKCDADYLNDWCKKIDKNFPKTLKEIEEKSSISLYYQAFLRLNFYKQVDLFQKIVKQNSIGACIIHGEQGSGQSWLLHRLIREIPNESKHEAKVIKINMKIYSPNINSVFAQINKHLTGKHQLSKNEITIIDGIYNCLKTQNVIIVFKEVDRISEQYIKELIHKLWLQLVNKAQHSSLQPKIFKLFMFLIDEVGCVEKWTIQLKDSYDNNWKPDFPVKLPLIDKLSCQDLNDWIKNHKNVLPNDLTKLEESDIKTLLKTWDNGLFMTVLPQICDKCDGSLWEHIEKCLTS
jgi:hypothetical protein